MPHSREWKRACVNLITSEVKVGLRRPARELSCQGFCCEGKAIHYHHPDYDQPWLVVALCGTCHGLFHKYAREGL
jgi:hypothetical protein